MDEIVCYFTELQRIINALPRSEIARVVDLLYQAWRENRQVFICGNGGSATTAAHFACDLGKGLILPGKARFRVMTLADNPALMTAWANDCGYDQVFAEQLLNWVQPGDVVIVISGSGNSANVVKAISVARAMGAVTVALTGCRGGKLKEIVDYCIVVPSDRMVHIEDVHLMLEHCICQSLKGRMAMSGLRENDG